MVSAKGMFRTPSNHHRVGRPVAKSLHGCSLPGCPEVIQTQRFPSWKGDIFPRLSEARCCFENISFSPIVVGDASVSNQDNLDHNVFIGMQLRFQGCPNSWWHWNLNFRTVCLSIWPTEWEERKSFSERLGFTVEHLQPAVHFLKSSPPLI